MSGWDTLDIAVCSETMPTYVLLSPLVISQFHIMMQLAGKEEWLGYLALTEKDEGGVKLYTVHQMILPYQYASAAHVDVCLFPQADAKAIMENTNAKLSGVVHSHHDMNISYSSTDEEYINVNNDVSILLRHNFSFEARARAKTACGKTAMIKAVVIPLLEDMLWMVQAMEQDYIHRVKSTKKEYAVGYGKLKLNEWEYKHPTESIAHRQLEDTIYLTENTNVRAYIIGGNTDEFISADTADNDALGASAEECIDEESVAIVPAGDQESHSEN